MEWRLAEHDDRIARRQAGVKTCAKHPSTSSIEVFDNAVPTLGVSP
jgi:hypothetical protein